MTRTKDPRPPGPGTTLRFLTIVDVCYGESQGQALAAVQTLRNQGARDLPAHDDWPEWSRAEMRAVIRALQRHCGCRVPMRPVSFGPT